MSAPTELSRPDPESWDGAIEEAERQLAEVEKRRRRLWFALRVFRQLKKEGAPWPTAEHKPEEQS